MNSSGSFRSGAMYAIMHIAQADLSSKPLTIFARPSGPMLLRNHLMQGPGSPLYALQQRDVSSTTTGFLSSLQATMTFYLAISRASPWSSGTTFPMCLQSTSEFSRMNSLPRMLTNSSSFFFYSWSLGYVSCNQVNGLLDGFHRLCCSQYIRMYKSYLTSSMERPMRAKSKLLPQVALGPWENDDRVKISHLFQQTTKLTIHRASSNIEFVRKIISTPREEFKLNKMTFDEKHILSSERVSQVEEIRKPQEVSRSKPVSRPNRHRRNLVLPALARPIRRQFRFVDDEVIHIQNT